MRHITMEHEDFTEEELRWLKVVDKELDNAVHKCAKRYLANYIEYKYHEIDKNEYQVNIVNRFLKTRFVETDNYEDYIPLADLYCFYENYTQSQGLLFPVPKFEFRDIVADSFPYNLLNSNGNKKVFKCIRHATDEDREL